MADLKDSDIQRFLRLTLTESAAATYTEFSADTQLSIDRGMIWLINRIEYQISIANLDDAAQNTAESIQCHIARESQSTVLSLSDPDCIDRIRMTDDRYATIGTEAGPLNRWAIDPFTHTFNPPLPYAATTIYGGIISTCGSAATAIVRIGYTLIKVSDKFFYRVAQALIS